MLAEMLRGMLPHGHASRAPLHLEPATRADLLACPACTEPMQPCTLHQIDIDRCPKHGVWFDPHELRVALYRTADPANPPPFRELPPTLPPRPQLEFVITTHDGVLSSVVTRTPVIKIGTIASCHIRLVDPTASRMHAVIEVTDRGLWIIDLGSDNGTYVNDQRQAKCALRVGHVIRIGKTRLELAKITAA